MDEQKKITAPLSPKDTSALLEIINACVHCRKTLELILIIRKVGQISGLNGASIGYFNIENVVRQEETAYKFINIGFPEEFMDNYLARELYFQDVPVMAFINTLEPQNWQEAIKVHNEGKPTELENELSDYGLLDGWVYGTVDANRLQSSIMSYTSETPINNSRSRSIVRLITPHLSEAYKRILKIEAQEKYHLTPRETEVLNWLKEGKTSWEISQILSLSERGVNFHIDNLKTKLDSTNRIQAVAVALGKNLISL